MRVQLRPFQALLDTAKKQKGMGPWARVFALATRDDENLARARVSFALWNFRHRNYLLALEQLMAACRLVPREPSIHFAKAVILHHARLNHEAECSLQEALDLDPRFEPAWHRLHTLFVQTGQHNKAARTIHNHQRIRALLSEAAHARRPQAVDSLGQWLDARDGVWIIVPVHNARNETIQCLQTLLAANCITPSRIVVVDDASNDPTLVKELNQYAESNAITLIRLRHSHGFIGAVNSAIRAIGEQQGDFVLLNSDTLTPPGWIDRLRTAAYSHRHIATVTPLSNNGEMMSFPVPSTVNPMPAMDQFLLLDKAAQEANAGKTVQTPVGVGFCMYITRNALNDVGLLDETHLRRGYGEESDFCMRAAQKGYTNIVATDLFVAHKGSVSFGIEKRLRVLQNLQVLENRYPDYRRSVERFVSEDGLLSHRRAIELQLLGSFPKGGTIIVYDHQYRDHPEVHHLRWHGASTGQALYLMEIRQEIRSLKVSIKLDAEDGPQNLIFALPDEEALLGSVIETLDFEAAQIVHAENLPAPLARLLHRRVDSNVDSGQSANPGHPRLESNPRKAAPPAHARTTVKAKPWQFDRQMLNATERTLLDQLKAAL